MSAAPIRSHPERRALLISLAVHAVLLLLLGLAYQNQGKTLQVSLVVEQKEEVQRLEIEEEEETLTPLRKSRRANGANKKQQATTRRPGSTGDPKSSGKPQDQWANYEQAMHTRNRNSASHSVPATSDAPRWGSEKTGRSGKRGESEQVAVPKGDSKSSTRWRRGSARRLLTMPAIDYPESVRRKSGQGQVELQIEVNAQGRVEEVEIIKSSGYTRLDINARNAYRNAVFSPSPAGESAVGIVIVTFRMRDN